MKEWLIGIIAVVLISSIASYILPHGKMGKFIKGFFSFAVIFAVVSPLINFNLINIDFDSILPSDNIYINEEFLEYSFNKRVEALEVFCIKQAEQVGVKNLKIEIFYDAKENKLDITKVKLNFNNAVYLSDKEHKVMIDETINLISKSLSIDPKDIITYE